MHKKEDKDKQGEVRCDEAYSDVWLDTKSLLNRHFRFYIMYLVKKLCH